MLEPEGKYELRVNNVSVSEIKVVLVTKRASLDFKLGDAHMEANAA